MTALPVTRFDEYHEAVQLAGHDAAVGGEAALDLWDVADVNPRRIDVVVPRGRRLRGRGGERYAVTHTDLGPADIDFVDGVPVVVPAAAIRQVIDEGMDGTLVEQAITTSARRDLLSPLAEARLRVALADRHQGPPRAKARPL
ncbi:MAG: hypothetical protein M3063_03305 [Actinomycetota bacterium]|nr:hypothetical protein [Actinomycetota bacterium]MDQ6946173.1 hypothetical protein [Actinomycetota bacterium]